MGKSTFLSKVTKTRSEVASYAFTTLTAIPGVLEYGGAEIQLLDLPGIIEGAAEGKGRGRQVISAAKTSDLILMVLDATKKAEQRALLEAELEAVGIRLNREPPYVFTISLFMAPLPFPPSRPPTPTVRCTVISVGTNSWRVAETSTSSRKRRAA